MKFGKITLERFVLAFERAIEKALSNTLKSCEVNVSVVIKPIKEENDGNGSEKRSDGGRSQRHP